jgi:PKD repeat protein
MSVFSASGNFEDIQGQVKFENGSIGADEYFWDFGNGTTSYNESPEITYNEDGEYLIQLFAKNSSGCVDSSGMIYRMMYKGLWIPNAMVMKPISGSQLWKPVGVNLAYYNAEIYSRWGKLLWSSTLLNDKGEPAEGWDGTYEGKLCQEGNYVWKVSAMFRDGSVWHNDDIGNHEKLTSGNSGTITLIR